MFDWLGNVFQVDWAKYLPRILDATGNTLIYLALGFAGAVVLGLVLALMRTSKLWILRAPAGFYTEAFKNTPLLVIIFVFHFGLKSVVVDGTRLGLPELQLGDRTILLSGVLSLVCFYAAYLSEIFRAALAGVHHGQREAAQALGLSRVTTFGSVIFPQGVRLALAGTNTMMVDMLKSTSLLYLISAGELFLVGKSIGSETYRLLEVMVVIGAIYFVMCYPLSQLALWLERRVQAGAPLSPRRARLLRNASALLGTPETRSAA